MAESAARPPLRLVGRERTAPQPMTHPASPAEAIARENHAAATNQALDPRDPRWAFAMRTRSQLQGAVLTPERRERLIREAGTMNLRPFDANVIIALVQDGARRDESFDRLATSLSFVRRPTRRSTADYAWRWAIALMAALVANMLLIRWFIG